MEKFWIPWGIDAVAATIVVYFSFVGLAGGSVSSFNIELWIGILLAIAGILGGGLWLRSAGCTGLAVPLLLVRAVPSVLYALFIAVVVIMNPRWN
jgi:hypothetical protein